MSPEMQTLVDAVTRSKTVQDGTIVFLNGLVPRLQEAAGDKAKVLELAAELQAETDSLGTALAANTEADPQS